MQRESIPISALQHFLFCPRQCALIHVEGLWAENRLTVEGSRLHRRAHADELGPRGARRAESRPGVRVTRGLSLVCDALGIHGKADVVEFHDPPRESAQPGLPEPSPVSPIPFPIEYKRGRPKKHDADRVQLCAQALCLEEMLKLPPGGVPLGAIFYGQTRRRLDVAFDDALRARTLDTIERCRAMIESGQTPRAVREEKCDRCSLVNLCLPVVTQERASAARFADRELSRSLLADAP